MPSIAERQWRDKALVENTVSVLVVLSLLEGLVSLRQLLLWARYCRAPAPRPAVPFTPAVSVFCPCRGLDFDLQTNAGSLAEQDYPDFEVLFILQDPSDPAHRVLEDVVSAHPLRARLITREPGLGRSYKISSLLAGLEHRNPCSQVFVFADSDTRYETDWLRHLVHPLHNEYVGASTGYRWYLPLRGNFSSVLRSNWNAGIATLLGDHGRNFCWGGSCAVTREVFEKAEVGRAWTTALSDDYVLTRQIRKAGLRIKFVPQCLVGSFEDCTLRELMEWAARQVKITRVYAPRLWAAAFGSVTLFTTAWLGCVWLMIRPPRGIASLLGGGLALFGLLSFAPAKGWFRYRTLLQLKPHWKDPLRRSLWAYLWLGLPTSWLTLLAMICSLLSRKLTWRGITYLMRSPHDVTVFPKRPGTDS